jgi:transcriptional regulator with XRE-family HTH domain
VDDLHRRVAARIRALAKQKKIPLTHLPDRAGVSRSHFWDVVACKKSPTLAWLGRVAEALGVDAGDLVYDEGRPRKVAPGRDGRKG